MGTLTAIVAATLGRWSVRLALISQLITALIVGGYLWGHHVASVAGAAAVLTRSLAEARSALEATQTAGRDALARAAELQLLNASLNQQVATYAQQLSGLQARVSGSPPLAPVAGPSCLLGADDLQRLRAMR